MEQLHLGANLKVCVIFCALMLIHRVPEKKKSVLLCFKHKKGSNMLVHTSTNKHDYVYTQHI